MTIEQANVVDFTTWDPATGEASLIVADHLSWNEDRQEHLLMLQEKINSYIRFLDGGEFYDAHPKARGKVTRIVIKIVGKYPMNGEAQTFYERARDFLEQAGFILSFELFDGDS